MEKKNNKYDFSLFDSHNLLNQNILVSYKGPIDERIMTVIGDNIVLVANDTNDKARTKIFKVFMELAQNVWLYSSETCKLENGKSVGMGSLVIGEFGNYYTFVTGNVVKNADIVPVIDKCEMINSLDRESLREYRREQRRLAQSGKPNSGNIGLIQVALTAESPLDIELTPVNDDESFFSIAVKISKNCTKK
ncbi:MAG: SiaB family protein kinase [Bacteroidales bacterium]|nr:SiaB family protein kinase [Bacteroidales bacterium]